MLATAVPQPLRTLRAAEILARKVAVGICFMVTIHFSHHGYCVDTLFEDVRFCSCRERYTLNLGPTVQAKSEKPASS